VPGTLSRLDVHLSLYCSKQVALDKELAEPMSKLKSLKHPVNKDLVELLNAAMEKVLKGEIIGITMLTNHIGNEYSHEWAGEMKMSEVVNVFHEWEFNQRVKSWQKSQETK
jgi:hypothetical protein